MINKALKLIREFHTLTQSELSTKLGISKSYLCEIEREKKPIGYDLLEKYSDIFDVPVSSLVFFSENLESSDTIPEKFRHAVAEKILRIMEWQILRNEAKKA